MTAASVNSRPTVEATTKAHAAFAWGFRGQAGKAGEALAGIDDAGLTAVMMAAALVYHLAEAEAANREETSRLVEGLLDETAGGAS